MPKIKRTVITLGKHSKAIIIPAVFCEMLGIEVGTPISMELVGIQIVIKKAKEEAQEKKEVGKERRREKKRLYDR